MSAINRALDKIDDLTRGVLGESHLIGKTPQQIKEGYRSARLPLGHTAGEGWTAGPATVPTMGAMVGEGITTTPNAFQQKFMKRNANSMAGQGFVAEAPYTPSGMGVMVGESVSHSPTAKQIKEGYRGERLPAGHAAGEGFVMGPGSINTTHERELFNEIRKGKHSNSADDGLTTAPGRAAADETPAANRSIKDTLFTSENKAALKTGLWGAGIGAIGGGLASTQNENSSAFGSMASGALIGGLGGAAASRIRSFRAKAAPDNIAAMEKKLADAKGSLTGLNNDVRATKGGRKTKEGLEKYNSAVNRRNAAEKSIDDLKKDIAANKALMADPSASALKWGLIGAGGSYAMNAVSSNSPVNPTPKQF